MFEPSPALDARRLREAQDAARLPLARGRICEVRPDEESLNDCEAYDD